MKYPSIMINGIEYVPNFGKRHDWTNDKKYDEKKSYYLLTQTTQKVCDDGVVRNGTGILRLNRVTTNDNIDKFVYGFSKSNKDLICHGIYDESQIEEQYHLLRKRLNFKPVSNDVVRRHMEL